MLKRHRLILQESFEYTGLWWLPEKPDERIGGTLLYSPSEGVHLKLLGALDPAFPFAKDRWFETDVVHGVTSNGMDCTLFGNTQLRYTTAGFLQHELVSDFLILGHHYQSRDELYFTKWKISFENLDDWIAPNLFDQTFGHDDEGTLMITTVAKPEDYFEEFVEAINGRIVLTADILSGGGDSSGKPEILKDAFFVLEPDTLQPFKQYRQWLNDIQNLMSLLMAENIQSRKIHGFVDDAEEENHPARLGVSIFFLPRYRDYQRSTRWYDMLVTFGGMKEHLATALERWLGAEHNLRQAVILYLAETNPRVLDVDTQFVNIMHALESYHRSISDGSYLSKEEYQPFLDKMVQAVPVELDSDHRKALKDRLGYGYQYSQRKRFRELFDLLGADLQELVTSKIKPFVNEVVDTRNYLVHRDESSKGLTLEGGERLYAYRRLRMLMTILFLRHIGFDEDFIYLQVSKNRRVKNFFVSQDEEE